jgi:hypothetical protein
MIKDFISHSKSGMAMATAGAFAAVALAPNGTPDPGRHHQKQIDERTPDRRQ